MEILIYDNELNNIAMLENASVIWVTRYYDIGDFELYMPFSHEYINLLKVGYYVGRNNVDQLGIIENINISYNVENGSYLKVTGRLAEGIIARRIVWNQTRLSGLIESKLRDLVIDNVINPSDIDRKIEEVALGQLKNLDIRIQAQFTGTNLAEAIKKVCQAAGLGWKLVFDKNNRKFNFELYSGVNRSYGQTVTNNPYVVFSDKYDNLNSSVYDLNTGNENNIAKIAGEGEGTARRTAVYGTGSGINRKEIFVDAKDISSNEGEIGEEEYTAQLLERGSESLVNITELFSGEIIVDTNQYTYRKDFNIGDIVTIENEEWNLSINSRIIEIIESEDDTGYRITLTFGT